jgi:hypothetical protein
MITLNDTERDCVNSINDLISELSKFPLEFRCQLINEKLSIKNEKNKEVKRIKIEKSMYFEDC